MRELPLRSLLRVASGTFKVLHDFRAFVAVFYAFRMVYFRVSWGRAP